MDWRRAKTILIIAFLALDLYLGSLLYTNYQENTSRVAKNTIPDSQIDYLAQSKNINLKLLKEKEPLVPEVMTVYSGMTTQLNLKSWKQIRSGVYWKKLDTPISIQGTPKEIKSLLQKEQLPNLDDFRFEQLEVTKTAISIYQYKNGFPIFNGMIRLNLNNKKVESYQFSHYDKLKEEPQPHRPNKFNNALASLLLQCGSNTTIHSAQLGYQRNSYQKGDQDSIFTPIWRFQVGSDYYYVNTTSSDSISNVQPATNR